MRKKQANLHLHEVSTLRGVVNVQKLQIDQRDGRIADLEQKIVELNAKIRAFGAARSEQEALVRALIRWTLHNLKDDL